MFKKESAEEALVPSRDETR